MRYEVKSPSFAVVLCWFNGKRLRD